MPFTQAIYASLMYMIWERYLHYGTFVHQWNMRVKELMPFFKVGNVVWRYSNANVI